MAVWRERVNRHANGIPSRKSCTEIGLTGALPAEGVLLFRATQVTGLRIELAWPGKAADASRANGHRGKCGCYMALVGLLSVTTRSSDGIPVSLWYHYGTMLAPKSLEATSGSPPPLERPDHYGR